MRFTRLPLAAALCAAAFALPATAQTIFPINRAEILAGSRFDVKVEFPGSVDAANAKLSINGQDYHKLLGKSAELIADETGKGASSLILRNVVINKAGVYSVEASDGTNARKVTWKVYATPAKAAAKNVILFIGDGFSVAHRTAARILSLGIEDGKIKGKLAMDELPAMALLTTQGTDSIITDSANAAHAYTTGHKSCVNALGVYCSRAANSLDHPKVETLGELAKRQGYAVGAVTNSEIEDATPAA